MFRLAAAALLLLTACGGQQVADAAASARRNEARVSADEAADALEAADAEKADGQLDVLESPGQQGPFVTPTGSETEAHRERLVLIVLAEPACFPVNTVAEARRAVEGG